MFQPRVFCVKLQLHFGGDIHEISVPAYDGAEPTVADLMNVVERDFRVPRALQNLVFHGQELHAHPNEPLSHFGIKNLGAIRLVGRMAPPDMIQQINAQYNPNLYQQTNYTQQQQQYQQTNYNQQPSTIATFHTTQESLPYYYEHFQYEQKPSVGTQYDPPPPTPPNKDQPPPTPNKDQPPPTPNKDQPPPTPNRDQPPPTPNKGQISERSNGEQQKPPATPNSSNTK
jgi:hypothetical protein